MLWCLVHVLRFCETQGWIASAADLIRSVGHRKRPPDRSRALSRADVEQLLTRENASLRERTFWRLAYESAARSAELLALNVEDLDLPNRRARVLRKGGSADVITWSTRTARLLPRLLKGRKSGPVFLTERRARMELPPGDIDQDRGRARLSYVQAEQLFKAVSGGATLHQLRHSALTHLEGRHVGADADDQKRPRFNQLPGQVRAAVSRSPGQMGSRARSCTTAVGLLRKLAGRATVQ